MSEPDLAAVIARDQVREVVARVARAETHVTAYHRVDYETEPHDILLGGRYLDRLERRAGQWRIAHRTMLYDWSRDLGAAADLSTGVMGVPYHAPHFAGRAHGDYSDIFFGA
ncbi:MAG TPA: nuclear transport factor 2 family protein [Trebonia sp.]|nr:nuclear transport factor 2 family protein [Trebonia sp.]